MIEIPEAASLSRQIVDKLGGKTIASVVAGHTEHKLAWFYGETQGFEKVASGAVISDASAVGGMVEISAGEIRLLFSEGVNLRFHPSGVSPPAKHQLLFTFSDGATLSAAVQMYGGMGLFPAGGCDNEYYLGSRDKPSVLSGEFNEAYFQSILEHPGSQKLSAKALLATEQRIPGLGNGVLQDILYNAGINPKTKVNTLDERRRSGMFASVKETITKMAAEGGRDTELDLDGNPGGYQTLMSRKTVGHPCSRCGQEIQKVAYMGGSVYICPGCQPQ